MFDTKSFYPSLGISFLIDHHHQLFIQDIHKAEFSWASMYRDEREQLKSLATNDLVVIPRGSKTYWYQNLYEVMLWYYYYSIPKHNIVKQMGTSAVNEKYFSRIPTRYRKNSKGLTIVRKALHTILRRHLGIPKYYDPEVLSAILVVK